VRPPHFAIMCIQAPALSLPRFRGHQIWRLCSPGGLLRTRWRAGVVLWWWSDYCWPLQGRRETTWDPARGAGTPV